MEKDLKEAIGSLLSNIDGSVQSQGVPVSVRSWLDMGSKEWQQISDIERARAYQAAMVTGWSDDALCSIMSDAFEHLNDDIMTYTIKLLQELAIKFPVEVEVIEIDDSQIGETDV